MVSAEKEILGFRVDDCIVYHLPFEEDEQIGIVISIGKSWSGSIVWIANPLIAGLKRQVAYRYGDLKNPRLATDKEIFAAKLKGKI